MGAELVATEVDELGRPLGVADGFERDVALTDDFEASGRSAWRVAP